MMSPYEIKKEICEIGRRIYMNGFVASMAAGRTVGSFLYYYFRF